MLACREAVADAGLTLDQIDLLVMNTITPDHADPGCACFLQAKLGLGTVPVFDIKQQCTGLIYGMALADQFIRGGTARHVLIACSEVLSRRIDGSNDGRNIGILFGDGGGGRGRRPFARRAPRHRLHHPACRRAVRQGPLHGGPRQRAWAARNT